MDFPLPLFRVVSPTWMGGLMLCLAGGLVRAQEAGSTDAVYRMPPDALVQLVDAPPTPAIQASPDGTRMVLMEQPSLPSIAELAEPELRLAGMRINPQTNGNSRSRPHTGLTFTLLSDQTEQPVTGLPDPARIEDVRWSPDGRHLAFTVTLDDRIELWVADAGSARARRLTDRPLNDIGTPCDWMPDSRALACRLLPADRTPPAAAPTVPSGPVIQENTEGTAPARTYQDLLEDAHDEALFTHYMTSQLALIHLDGTETELGTATLVSDVSPSPDGRYLLVETLHEPFSYLVPYYRFPHRIEVWDTTGQVVHEVADLPLAESVPTAFGSVPTGVRSVAWRADAAATLYWSEALDGGDARAEAEHRDQVFMHAAPFTGEPTPLATLPLRYGGVDRSEEGPALVYEYWWSTRTERTHMVDPGNPGDGLTLLFDHSTEDRYNDPGTAMTKTTPQGTSVLRMADDGASIFMRGEGASPEGNRPFVRKLNLETKATDDLFRSAEPYYEWPVAFLDEANRRLLTEREAVDQPGNYFVRDLDAGTVTRITDFPHPYPDLADIQKEFITYEREDGVQLSANLYLPAGYDAGRDGPLPALVWAYPVEYKSADAAGQIDDSPYRFNAISYWGALPYVTQGYAVLDQTAMPIVGEGDTEPNDSFRQQLVMNAQAVLLEGTRRGVVDPDRVAIGGHSYGAFMSGNLLAHSDLFRAGIARSGAYNRTLTPFGFQREERTFWQTPELYFGMSPFMHAEKVNEPILLIHGQADNNSGTFPIQSERFYNALKGHGATVRLVMLPHESHGYQARESILHMLWETNRWLDLYVKNAPPREPGTDTGLIEGERKRD